MDTCAPRYRNRLALEGLGYPWIATAVSMTS